MASGLKTKMAVAVSLAAAAAAAAAAVGGSAPVAVSNEPQSFTLSPTSPTVTYTYRAVETTRFAVVAAHSSVGLVTLTVTKAGWDVNRTVGKDPGLTIAFGHDGSVRQNPADNGACNREAMAGWNATTYTDITITLSIFALYAASGNYSTSVQLTVMPYGVYAPLPGGCCTTCLESNADATVVIRDKGSFDATIVPAQAEPSSYQWDWGYQCPCDAVANPDAAAIVEYNLYFYFIGSCGSPFKRTFSDTAVSQAMKRMSTVEDVLKYGTKLTGPPLVPAHFDQFFHVDATAGQGVIYTVVATDRRAQAYQTGVTDSKRFMAAYASYSTFRCRIEGPAAVNCSAIPSRTDCDLYPECVWQFSGYYGHCTLDPDVQSCDGLFNVRDLVLTMVVGLCGLFIAFFGHKYFVSQLAMDATLLFGTCVYIGLEYTSTPLKSSSHVWLSVGGGVGGALVMLYWWFWSRGIAISLVVIGSVSGLVLTAAVFATPFGEYRVWQNPFNFGMAAVCGLLIPPIFMMLWDRSVTIVGAAISGSYFFLVGVDFFVASSFDDMALNMVRRLVDTNFGKDYSGNIFSDEFNGCSNVELNIAMLAAWAGLSVVAAVFQFKVSAWLPDGAPKGAGSPPSSDRFDGQLCPFECTRLCLCRNPAHTTPRQRPRHRVDEGWGTEEEGHPLVEVSGSSGFRGPRGSTSSWGSWTWMRNTANRSRRTSPLTPSTSVHGHGRGRRETPEARPLLRSGVPPIDGAGASRRGSTRSSVYEDELPGRSRDGRLGSTRSAVYEDELSDEDRGTING
eukprot:CAMPEP_0206322850 /NCGR_PEP_ID=MMETSP0106_2-20121207/19651_1 /ASSEMBLY_ACC=CAM_ASM_000206 /TAXON_ID=81532 /ORGANISM="Acanthoeca-like sp., Strain 10tr" /LENGTH=788 /DNA_ID=CAMNT_0053755061 /DNA_START=79 /DNA_END=2445 /DNA_ORIENTATION=+